MNTSSAGRNILIMLLMSAKYCTAGRLLSDCGCLGFLESVDASCLWRNLVAENTTSGLYHPEIGCQ